MSSPRFERRALRGFVDLESAGADRPADFRDFPTAVFPVDRVGSESPVPAFGAEATFLLLTVALRAAVALDRERG